MLSKMIQIEFLEKCFNNLKLSYILKVTTESIKCPDFRDFQILEIQIFELQLYYEIFVSPFLSVGCSIGCFFKTPIIFYCAQCQQSWQFQLLVHYLSNHWICVWNSWLIIPQLLKPCLIKFALVDFIHLTMFIHIF